ncbi:MAG: hypothetical protein H6604_04825 [Flavobacteriales bacterium]|nr:hypothetical protein [Flavobacteriales bacterium]
MKIIQSFWAGDNHDVLDAKGWLSAKYHWLGWILSVNQLRKYHEEVELYTDEFGYKILIETLQLPYTKVNVVLDKLNSYPSGLWALAKIEAYSLCKTPFIHVDGDVFVWESLTDKFETAKLVTQNLEHTTEYYRTMWNNITAKITTIPNEMQNFHKNKSNNAYNMGIFGGNDMDFMSYYTKLSYEFVNKNKDFLKDIDLFNFNIFFEQVLFYELTTQQNKKVEVLIHEDIGDNEYHGFADFERVPTKKTYLHLLGVFKRNEVACKKMEDYILRFYPEFIPKLKTILPNEFNYFDFEYSFTFSENEKLRKEYLLNTLNNTKIQINNKNLYIRNLFFQDQNQFFNTFIENKTSFYILKLIDFELIDQKIKVFDYNDNFKEVEIDEIDLIIFSELKQPILFNSFLKNIETYLGNDFSEEDTQEFKNTITLRILHLIQDKVLAVIKYV